MPKKFKLSSLTSKQGLITGSILGLGASLTAAYFLVPIFEKSESNAVEIVEVAKTLEQTEDKYADTANELKETQGDLTLSNKKLNELTNVESDLKDAKNQISELETASQKDGEAIEDLQTQVEDKESNIQDLTQKKVVLNRIIEAKELAIKQRSEWIKELEKHDDIVIENATNLVENFMKISDSKDKDMNSRARDELLLNTLSLVNTLESRLNKRRIFLEDLDSKIN